MFKLLATLSLVFLILSWLSDVNARSATASQYQQVNGIDDDTKTLNSDTENASTQNIWKDLSMVYKVYQQCSADNLSVCLKVKLLAGLERVFRAPKNLKIMDGVQFIKIKDDDSKPTQTPIPSEQEIEAALPRANDAKEYILNNMIFKKLANFLQEHTLSIKFPDIRNAADNEAEGRGKKKKKEGGGAYIMIPLLLGGTFVPIAYGALAMLAGKALIVSKLALVLASIIGIKKLLSGGGKESSHEVVVSSGGSHSGWGRDMDLAFNGWKPGSKEATKTA